VGRKGTGGEGRGKEGWGIRWNKVVRGVGRGRAVECEGRGRVDGKGGWRSGVR